LNDFINIAKALSDENRVRILLALRDHELCVCQLTLLLGLAPSTVSKHITVLKQAGLVGLRKDGRWAYYRLIREKTPGTVSRALKWLMEAAKSSQRASEDQVELEKILKCDREEICKRIGEG
jgi:DNA-binding transcriptional ArsR family regulator